MTTKLHITHCGMSCLYFRHNFRATTLRKHSKQYVCGVFLKDGVRGRELKTYKPKMRVGFLDLEDGGGGRVGVEEQKGTVSNLAVERQTCKSPPRLLL